MANEKLFNSRAANYQEGRPGYAKAATDMIVSELLKKDDKIADIGSGTGIFSKEFITRGFDVYCVEPNDEMRRQAEEFFGDNPHFISVAATAEHTTLPDKSINAVTAASAFHWFDTEGFRRECERILTPEGYVILIINARSYNDEFTVRQHEICAETCNGFHSLRHGLERMLPKVEGFFRREMHSREFDFPLEYTKDKFIKRSLSSSYAPAPDDPRYRLYADKLRELMEEFAPGSDKITEHNTTVMYWGKKKKKNSRRKTKNASSQRFYAVRARFLFKFSFSRSRNLFLALADRGACTASGRRAHSARF